ncbi:hypothetical protein V6N13_126911 [Hibiscus sabdariffa]
MDDGGKNENTGYHKAGRPSCQYTRFPNYCTHFNPIFEDDISDQVVSGDDIVPSKMQHDPVQHDADSHQPYSDDLPDKSGRCDPPTNPSMISSDNMFISIETMVESTSTKYV